jgi:hypothetical protein
MQTRRGVLLHQQQLPLLPIQQHVAPWQQQWQQQRRGHQPGWEVLVAAATPVPVLGQHLVQQPQTTRLPLVTGQRLMLPDEDPCSSSSSGAAQWCALAIRQWMQRGSNPHQPATQLLLGLGVQIPQQQPGLGLRKPWQTAAPQGLQHFQQLQMQAQQLPESQQSPRAAAAPTALQQQEVT